MNLFDKFVRNVQLRRFTVLFLIVLLLFFAKSMMTTILLTFIFTLLVTKLVNLIRKKIKIPIPILVITIYLIIVGGLGYLAVKYIPMILEQAINASNAVIDFYQNPGNFGNSNVQKVIMDFVNNYNLTGQIKHSITVIWSYVTSVGSVGVALLISLLLSFFFTLEMKQMKNFSRKFLDSTFAWFFQDIFYFAKTFIQTFGVVLEAQFFIAICNTVITTVCLFFMGIPQLLILAIMIFFLSLIPVAGAIISLIPLALIGYSVGGIQDVIYIVIVIACVHALEAYVLNPKFMSARTELPIFYTFVVLLIGEHLFGGWGLIVSVPIFTFMLDILGVQKVNHNSEPPIQTGPINDSLNDEKKL